SWASCSPDAPPATAPAAPKLRSGSGRFERTFASNHGLASRPAAKAMAMPVMAHGQPLLRERSDAAARRAAPARAEDHASPEPPPALPPIPPEPGAPLGPLVAEDVVFSVFSFMVPPPGRFRPVCRTGAWWPPRGWPHSVDLQRQFRATEGAPPGPPPAG